MSTFDKGGESSRYVACKWAHKNPMNAHIAGNNHREERRSPPMSSLLERLTDRLQTLYQVWHDREIEYATYIERQQQIWKLIRCLGPASETEVLRQLAAAGEFDLPNFPVQAPRDVGWTFSLHPLLSRRVYRHRADLEIDDGGSPVMRLVAVDRDLVAPRQLTAVLHEVAASLEWFSDDLDVHWAIVADPHHDRITVQIASESEAQLACDLLTAVIQLHHLTPAVQNSLPDCQRDF
jgi:hypothetical protein